MNTTNGITENPQDLFILNFLHWLNINYVLTGVDEYHVNEAVIRGKAFTAAQCLALYRTQQIPPLPTLPNETTASYVKVINEAIHRSVALFDGLAKIQALLDPANILTKEQVQDIVTDTLNKIS